MDQGNLLNEIKELPPDAQKQIFDFIDFMKYRYKRPAVKKKIRNISLFEEPFVGMWKDRHDMKDAAAWVRNLRKSEWDGQDA